MGVYVTDKSTSTEGIRTTDPQFECPSARPTELIGKFLLATASSSTIYQHCYMYLKHFIHFWLFYFCLVVNVDHLFDLSGVTSVIATFLLRAVREFKNVLM